MSVFRAVILTIVLSGCATDLSYETEKVWCLGACIIEHTKADRHSETTRKSEKSEKKDK